MRITVDRGRDGVRLALSEAGVAETRALAEAIAAEYDAQGRLAAITIREVARLTGAPHALAQLTIDLSGEAGAPATRPPEAAARPPEADPPPSPRAAAPPPPRPLTPAERAALGPLVWEFDAEAAMARVPFFQRGARRRAVVELARARGLSRVTAEVVEETPRR